jgi:crystallin alpha B
MPYRALIPSVMGRDWWDMWDYPSRIMDQCFASHLCDEDLLPPSYIRGYLLRPRTQANIACSGQSDVNNDDKEFQVALNVSQFKPEELQVKVVDNYVVVHGKHEEKSDEHGFVSREFTRRYMLPNACEMETVASSLSPDGVLTITAPKKALEAPPTHERNIPISKEIE